MTQIYNGKHPYQLTHVKGGGSTVYGWVNEKDIEHPALTAINKLAKLGVINSPDYWWKTVSGNKVKYLDIRHPGGRHRRPGVRWRHHHAGLLEVQL